MPVTWGCFDALKAKIISSKVIYPWPALSNLFQTYKIKSNLLYLTSPLKVSRKFVGQTPFPLSKALYNSWVSSTRNPRP